MASIPKWPGSGSAISGSTPFGTYDDDPIFQQQGPRIGVWVANRLGYPIVDVELTDFQIYTCFEEATSEYSSQVHQFNIRQNMMKIQGSPLDANLNSTNVQGGEMANIVKLASDYGSEVNVGGDIEIRKAHVKVVTGSQVYDLLTESSLSGSLDIFKDGKSNMEIKKIYHGIGPASSRFFDPLSTGGGSGGFRNMMESFGFGGFSPGMNFVLNPVYEDVLRIQAIELNDTIRRSAYTFKLTNNKLTVFPIPRREFNIWFDYILKTDRSDIASRSDANVVSDYSNAPYKNIQFSDINDIGHQWVKKYTLTLCKELLGAIREKYSSIPIPGSEVSLDGAALRAEAQQERDTLVQQLRENLEETGRRRQMEIESEIGDMMQSQLSRVPTYIFIG